MLIDYYTYRKTGWPKNIVEMICRNVEKVIKKPIIGKRKFKIGMTANPEQRFEQYLKESANWQKMHILYKTTSSNNQKEVESKLICALAEKYPKQIENKNDGGAGKPTDSLPRYVYVVVG